MNFLLLLFITVLFSSAFAGYSNVRTKNTYDGGLDSSCSYDEDCVVRNSFCKGNRVCACKYKFQYDRNNDACQPMELGLKCNDNEDCPFQRSECIDKTCQCQYNHVASEVVPNCLPNSRLQASCQDDQQCRVSDMFSHCNVSSRLCDCNSGYHASLDSQQCTPNKRVRDLCDSHNSCVNSPEERDAVECRPDNDGRRRCLCKSDYSVQNNICVKGAGGGAGQIIASITAIAISALVISFY